MEHEQITRIDMFTRWNDLAPHKQSIVTFEEEELNPYVSTIDMNEVDVWSCEVI